MADLVRAIELKVGDIIVNFADTDYTLISSETTTPGMVKLKFVEGDKIASVSDMTITCPITRLFTIRK